MNDRRTQRQPRVLFLAGLGRSGTTLVERALGMHEDVVVLGEVLHLWHRGLVLDELCGCGERFSRCPFWGDIGKHAFGGWDRVDPHRVIALRRRVDRIRRLGLLARRRLRGRDADAVREYARYFVDLYRAAAEVSGAPVVVDSSKQVTLAFCVSHLDDVDLRTLHCIRDSRAVAFSWSTVVQRPDSPDVRTQMDRYRPSVSAIKWMLHNGAVPLLGRRDVPSSRLRYEDFVAAPDRTIHQVARFAGLDPERFRPGSLGPDWLDLDFTHSVSGNPIRFQSGKVAVRRDDRWQDAMPAGSRRLVATLTWPLLKTYRYPLRTDRE